NQSFLQSISALGTDVFYLEKFPWERVDEFWKIRNRRDFSIEYAPAIMREARSVAAASVEASWNHPVKYKDRSAASVWTVGINEPPRRPYVFLMVKVRDPKQMEETKEELRGIMRKLRRVAPGAEDDFSINQQEQLVKTFHRVGGVIATIGLFITGLSLFVGGIGIMNIMFVSVAERTREIGIRKAIGAKRRTILVQFLIEAASVCLIGGLIGLAIAWALTLVIQTVLRVTL